MKRMAGRRFRISGKETEYPLQFKETDDLGKEAKNERRRSKRVEKIRPSLAYYLKAMFVKEAEKVQEKRRRCSSPAPR